jgi:hypothetical protein
MIIVQVLDVVGVAHSHGSWLLLLPSPSRRFSRVPRLPRQV